jgi:hypothetical protein
MENIRRNISGIPAWLRHNRKLLFVPLCIWALVGVPVVFELVSYVIFKFDRPIITRMFGYAGIFYFIILFPLFIVGALLYASGVVVITTISEGYRGMIKKIRGMVIVVYALGMFAALGGIYIAILEASAGAG